MLRRSFGDDARIPSLARLLATLPRQQAIELAMNTTTLDDLVSQLE